MQLMKRSTLIALAALAGCVGAITACTSTSGSSSDGSEDVGKVDINLKTPAGDQLDSVDMKIYTGGTATGTPVVQNTFDVHTDNALIKAFAGALAAPAASNPYTVNFVATGPSTTCTGTQTFAVVPNLKATVTVTMACTAASANPAVGSADITGQIVSTAACPYLKNVSIAPLQTDVGANVHLKADLSEAATVAWTHTSDGTIAAPAAFDTTYTCVSGGTKTISVTVTKAGTACTETISADVTCVDASGAGGAPGSGGAPPASGGAPPASGGAPPASGGAGSGGTPPGSGGAAATSACSDPRNTFGPTPKTQLCLDCESVLCPTNPTCDTAVFASDPVAKAQCQAALDCIRATNCMSTNSLDCFCGSDQDPGSCKNGPIGTPTGAHGTCLPEIVAAFPAGTTPLALYNNSGDVTIPGGVALSLTDCDLNNCGPVGGVTDCVPYCQ